MIPAASSNISFKRLTDFHPSSRHAVCQGQEAAQRGIAKRSRPIMVRAMRTAHLPLLMMLVAASSASAEWPGSNGRDGVEFVSKLQTAGGVELPQGAFRTATFSVW